MESLRTSLMIHLSATASPTIAQHRTPAVALKRACRCLPAVCRNLGRAKELGWKREVPDSFRGASTKGRKSVIHTGNRQRPGYARSYLLFPDPSLRVLWDFSFPVAGQAQPQGQSSNLFGAISSAAPDVKSSSVVEEASGVPRGPPIIPPNTPPILPPGTPVPIPPPNLPPIPPLGAAPPIAPPNTPPIPPGMPGPDPPPTPPPGDPPSGPEIPFVPPLGPELTLPPTGEAPVA